jgi:hypothetical protein
MTSERIPFLLASSEDQFNQLGSLLFEQPMRNGGHSKKEKTCVRRFRRVDMWGQVV